MGWRLATHVRQPVCKSTIGRSRREEKRLYTPAAAPSSPRPAAELVLNDGTNGVFEYTNLRSGLY
jgi:hypothetical protein